MAEDIIKLKGPTKASQPNAGDANTKTAPVFAVVKDNIDPIRSGRLQVYVSDFGGNDPDNRDNWISVSWMSPFFGSTVPDAGTTGFGSYVDNPSSYGMWHAPPDIGTTVICIFINGDLNYGFWIGCVPQPELLTMIPAIGGTENIITNAGEATSYGGSTRLPVTNINTNNKNIADSNDFINAAKPVHSYQAGIMTQQGVIRDPIRGPISSSAQRETPSRVGWGISTPGRPIYQGGYSDEALAGAATGESPVGADNLQVIARRGGHSIVMDDGDLVGKDQLVRIRSAKGHQILMSDDGQTLFILHSNGQSYVELGKEGTVDVYATNSINLRTQGDFNIHADRNVNIHAAKELNIQADNIKINSENELAVKSGTNTKFYSLSNFTVKSDSAMSYESKGDSSFVSQNITYINGSKINLNTGASSTIPEQVAPIPFVAHTDTLHDTEKGFAAAPGKLLSVTSRAPAHAPWANAGQGVDVKVDLSAASNLPAAPSEGTAAVNAAASTLPSSLQTNPSTAASVTLPNTSAISTGLDKNTTSAVLGSSAALASAASNPLKAAASTGFAVATSGGVTSLGVGTFAQTPSQLASAGVLKPGADKIVGAILGAQGTSALIGPPGSLPNINKILPSNLFTGKPGAQSATNYITNVAAQAAAQVVNLQKSQTALTQGGLLKGTESPSQLAGVVLSGAQVGIPNTLAAVNSAKSALAGGPGLQLDSNSATAAFKAISSGINAAGLSQNLTGGLGGISKALNTLQNPPSGAGLGLGSLLDATKGVAGSAFNTVLKQFKPLVPGIPQNLKTIAIANQKSVTDLATGTLPTPDGLAAKASSIASGLTNLPGGQKVVQSVIDKAGTAAAKTLNTLPGATTIKNTATAAFNKAVNNITPPGGLPTIPTGLGGLLNKASEGLSGGASAQLNSAISALSSGGKLPIKLPAVGFNTTDRGSLEQQLGSVLGNPKIPAPTFNGEISQAALGFGEAANAAFQRGVALQNEYAEKEKAANAALKNYYRLERGLPPGDPQIETAKQNYLTLLALAEDAKRRYEEVVKPPDSTTDVNGA